MAKKREQGWHLKGTVFQSCNCDYGCPCNFNAPPTYGKCEGQYTWCVEKGSFNGIKLDGLNFTFAGKWPEALHKGNGEALVLVDEKANKAQRDALTKLATGKVGGPWAIFATTITKLHSPKFVPYQVAISGVKSKLRAGNVFKLEMEPIKNPVTGVEASPKVVLPQGLVYNESTRASSRVFNVLLADGVRIEAHGRDAAIAPFEYKG